MLRCKGQFCASCQHPLCFAQQGRQATGDTPCSRKPGKKSLHCQLIPGSGGGAGCCRPWEGPGCSGGLGAPGRPSAAAAAAAVAAAGGAAVAVAAGTTAAPAAAAAAGSNASAALPWDPSASSSLPAVRWRLGGAPSSLAAAETSGGAAGSALAARWACWAVAPEPPLAAASEACWARCGGPPLSLSSGSGRCLRSQASHTCCRCCRMLARRAASQPDSARLPKSRSQITVSCSSRFRRSPAAARSSRTPQAPLASAPGTCASAAARCFLPQRCCRKAGHSKLLLQTPQAKLLATSCARAALPAADSPWGSATKGEGKAHVL